MLINMHTQRKTLRLKKIIIVMLIVFLMIIDINNSVGKAYAKDGYQESEQMVNVGITTDKSSYIADEDMSITVDLINYNNQFDGNITTMIVQLDYDATVISPYADTVKNIADKVGSMGFSHVDVSKSGSITYQYIDVEEPLRKDSPVLFSLKFKVNSSIASSDSIKEIINAVRVVMQDGSKKESVRYATSVDYIVDESSDSIASDDTIGLKEYNSSGELLSEDEQKSIQKNAVEAKKTEEEKQQEVINSNSTKKNTETLESKNESESTSLDSNNVLSHNNSKNMINGSLILPIVIAVIVVIVAGSLTYLCYKKKKAKKNVDN